MKRSSIYSVFVCAVALFAAAVGDAVVEGISNTGILWHGDYTDHSSLDLLPVFLLALIALALTQGLSLGAHARETGLSMRSLVLSTSRALVPRETVRLLPAIFALQLCVLFGMENVEQIVVYGHSFGGLLWLGGPIAWSLMIHAIISVAAAFCASKALGALSKTLARIVHCVTVRFIVRAVPRIVSWPERILCALTLLVTDSLVERGPPSFDRT